MSQLFEMRVSRNYYEAIVAAFLVAACNKPSTPAPTEVWAPGVVQTFRLDLDSSLSLGNAPPISIQLNSKLAVIARRDAGATKLNFSIKEPKLTTAGDASQLQQVLQQPFEAELQNGQLAKLVFESGASSEAVAIWRTIASSLVFSGATKGQDTWTSAEQDAAGQYQAKYHLVAPNRVEKHKTSYSTFTAAAKGRGAMQGLEVDVNVSESKGEFTFSEGRIAERWSNEILDSKWNGAPFARSNTKLKLVVENVSKAEAVPAMPNGTVTLLPAQPYQDPRIDERVLAAARSQDLNFDDVISALRAESLKQGEPGHELAAFGQIVALLKAQDARVADVVSLIRKSDPASRLLLDALGSASTPSSQDALVDLVELGSLDMALRKKAAYAAIRGSKPSPKLVEHLLRWMKDPAFDQYGVYGLGTAARHLREAGNVEQAKAIVSRLVKELSSAASQHQTVDLLRGLANAADPETLSVVRPRLVDAEPSVRAAAVDVVVRLAHPESARLLAVQLSREKERVTRVSLADSLRIAPYTPELAAAVREQLKTERDQQVLYKLVELAGLWIENSPQIRETLAQLSRGEIEPQVKGLIVGILEPPKKPSDK